MVHGQLLECVLAQAIHARIADVGNRDPVVVEEGCDDGRAHAFALGLDTDYNSRDGGVVSCMGDKLLLCGEEEVPLAEVLMLELRG